MGHKLHRACAVTQRRRSSSGWFGKEQTRGAESQGTRHISRKRPPIDAVKRVLLFSQAFAILTLNTATLDSIAFHCQRDKVAFVESPPPDPQSTRARLRAAQTNLTLKQQFINTCVGSEKNDFLLDYWRIMRDVASSLKSAPIQIETIV